MRTMRTTVMVAVVVALLGTWPSAAAAQDAADPMTPAYFTFTLESVEEPETAEESVEGPETAEDATGFTMELRGEVQVERVAATDPRASGLLTSVVNLNMLGVEGIGLVTGAQAMRLVNDGGAWSGTGQAFHAVVEGGGATVMATLTGEDGYEGLSLVMVQYYDDDVQTRRGFIIPSDQMPPLPDPIEPTAE